MKLLLALLATLTAGGVRAEALLVNGAGATFPYPIYSKWFDQYHKLNPELAFAGRGIDGLFSRSQPSRQAHGWQIAPGTLSSRIAGGPR